MKNRFSSSRSKRNHYNWFRGGEKNNASKVTKYTLTEEELNQLRKEERERFKNRSRKNNKPK